MPYIFFRTTADVILKNGNKLSIYTPQDFTCLTWKPSYREIYPRGLSTLYGKRSLVIWWLLQYLFSLDRRYRIFIIYHNNEIIHYTFLFSRHLRCPFMERHDLKLGHTWTNELYRGRGLATMAVINLVKPFKNTNVNFWWYCHEGNNASKRVAKKLGFEFVGRGTINLRLERRQLRYFTITDYYRTKG